MDLVPPCSKELAFCIPIGHWLCVCVCVCVGISHSAETFIQRRGKCDLSAANIYSSWGWINQHYERSLGASTTILLLHYSELVASSIKFIPFTHSLATVSGRISRINYSSHTAV